MGDDVGALRGRSVSQTHRAAREVGHMPDASHPWGPSARVLRAISEVDAPGSDGGTPVGPSHPSPLSTPETMLTPDCLSQVYGVTVVVTPYPVYGTPLIAPVFAS